MSLQDDAHGIATALQRVPTGSRVRVLAAPTVDGIASAAITLQTLRRTGRPFHVTYVRGVTDELLRQLTDEPDDATFFLGLGNEFSPRLRAVPGLHIVIDDEPIPLRIPSAEHVHVLNHRLHAEEPTQSSSAATATYVAGTAYGAQLDDLLGAALVGAWSRERFEPSPTGLTKHLHERATRLGLIHDEGSLALPEGPLIDTIKNLPSPWKHATTDLPDPNAWLAEHGLAPDANLHELNRPDLEHFASLLIVRALRNGTPATAVKELVRNIPRSTKHADLPLPRIANLVQSAAAEGEASTALQFLMGDTNVLPDLEALESKHHLPHHEIAHGHGGEPHA